MDWVAKIINGAADEFAHAKLVKYGIGTHPGPRVRLTVSRSRITFKADLDLEKVFLRTYASTAPEGLHKVSGQVITYTDRTEEFKALPVPLYFSRSKGKGAPVFKAKVKELVQLSDLKALLDLDGATTFFLLSVSPSDGTKPWKVATKTSFPKRGAPDSGGEEKKKDPTFTKGALANTPEVMQLLLSELLPDMRDSVTEKTKKVAIDHEIVIEDIEVPNDPSLSFSEKRRLAKKRGRLVRRITVDGDERVLEQEFFC